MKKLKFFTRDAAYCEKLMRFQKDFIYNVWHFVFLKFVSFVKQFLVLSEIIPCLCSEQQKSAIMEQLWQ